MIEHREKKTQTDPHTPAVGSRDGIYRYPPSDPRRFVLTLPDSMLRRMNRREYSTVMSWLRLCTREIHIGIDWESFDRDLVGCFINGGSFDMKG